MTDMVVRNSWHTLYERVNVACFLNIVRHPRLLLAGVDLQARSGDPGHVR